MTIKPGRILNRFDTSGLKRVRVDFKNPESQKAVKKVVQYLKNNSEDFQLEAGETYQSVAEDLVVDVIKEESFIVSSVPINEIIFSAVLKKLDSIPEDESWQATEVSEPDTEDAYHYIESLKFQGSEKQNKWAKDIALKNIETVAIALKQNKTIPAASKWWIENRDSISF